MPGPYFITMFLLFPQIYSGKNLLCTFCWEFQTLEIKKIQKQKLQNSTCKLRKISIESITTGSTKHWPISKRSWCKIRHTLFDLQISWRFFNWVPRMFWQIVPCRKKNVQLESYVVFIGCINRSPYSNQPRKESIRWSKNWIVNIKLIRAVVS